MRNSISDVIRDIYADIALYSFMRRTDVDLTREKIDKADKIHCELRCIMGTGMGRI